MFSLNNDDIANNKTKLLQNLKEVFSEFETNLKGRIENARSAAEFLGISEQMQNAILDAQNKANIDFYSQPGDPNSPFYELMKIKFVTYTAENVFISEIFRIIKRLEKEGSAL